LAFAYRERPTLTNYWAPSTKKIMHSKDWKKIIEGVAFGLVKPKAEGNNYFCEEFIVG
jgi:hypothetical protein